MALLKAVVPIQAVPTRVALDAQSRVAGRIVCLADFTTRAMLGDVLTEADTTPTPQSSPTVSVPPRERPKP